MLMKPTAFEEAFLRDLALNKRSWLDAARAALDARENADWSQCPDAWRRLANLAADADQRSAVLSVIDELLSGLSHSFLTTLDGATHLAETTLLEVRAEDRVPFNRSLHEFWPQYQGED